MTVRANLKTLEQLHELRVRVSKHRLLEARAVEAKRKVLLRDGEIVQHRAEIAAQDYFKDKFSSSEISDGSTASFLVSLYAGHQQAQRISFASASAAQRRRHKLDDAVQTRLVAANEHFKKTRKCEQIKSIVNDKINTIDRHTAELEEELIQDIHLRKLTNGND